MTECIKSVNSTISKVFEKVNKNFETITIHLQAIDKELNLLNAKVNKLNVGTEKSFGKVDVKPEDIKTGLGTVIVPEQILLPEQSMPRTSISGV